ncbi:MAG: hypothetical protein HY360_27395 [Verrucomicrobia bacterium]|nr:hypothetical protein [Verrucomicrobiota bacterium]
MRDESKLTERPRADPTASAPARRGDHRFTLGASVVLAVLVLYISDRAMRRAEKSDVLVASGQTGFSWLDGFLTKRAAQQTELRKLTIALEAARSVERRIQAHYAIVNFESKQGRPTGRRALASLRAIVTEGADLPQTIDAWRELLRLAQSHDTRDDFEKLLDAYSQAVSQMPVTPAKLLKLLDVWNLSADRRRDDLEIKALERVHREFPIAPEALAAYEALALKYRLADNRSRLAEVDESIRKTRRLIARQVEEQEFAQRFQAALQAKDIARAEETLASMSPGLLAGVDYWGFYSRFIALCEAENKTENAVRMLLKAAVVFPAGNLKDDQRASVLTSVALLHLEQRRDADAATALDGAPVNAKVKPWQQHARVQLWLAATNGPPPVTSARIPRMTMPPWVKNAAAEDTGTRWIALSGAASNDVLTTRWRAAFNATHLHIQVDCAEPDPGKMRAAHLKPDEKIWEDDCVEVFLCAPRSDAQYSQIISNSKGIGADLRYSRKSILAPLTYSSDLKWSANAAITAAATNTNWRVEFSIPWETLAIRPSDGVCFFNIRRQRYVTGKLELFSWSEGGKTGNDPVSMGLLFLDR